MSVSLIASIKNGAIGARCALFSVKDCLLPMNGVILGKLRDIVLKGHSIVVIEDSSVIELSEFTDACERLRDYEIPMVFYYCNGGRYVKPLSTSLEELCIPKDSYYVGRPDSHVLNSDCHNSDKLFAMNYGIAFKSCNKFFGPTDHDTLSFYYCDPSSIKVCEDIDYRSGEQEMIILMGQPGTGKSHMARVTGYEIVKKTEGWYPRLVKVLKEGKSVVIDECNPKYKDREQFIRIADKLSIPYKVIHIEMCTNLSMHMCRYRKITEGIDYDYKSALAIFYNIQHHHGSLVHKFTVNKHDPIMFKYL